MYIQNPAERILLERKSKSVIKILCKAKFRKLKSLPVPSNEDEGIETAWP